MIPKQTNTVDAPRDPGDKERAEMREAIDDWDYDECPNCDARYDLIKCNSCGYREQDEDECNCSDPGCPCGGFKYGTL
jgi:hypothetical protein